MRELVERKIDTDFPEIVLCLEHPPVITMGRRDAGHDLRADAAGLAERGIAVIRVERGGLLTYHGPGQIVVYPIFNLRRLRIGITDLVDGLEAAMIDALAHWGLDARARRDARGVYVGGAKIGSIGLAVRRGIAYHGLALNVDPDLSAFDLFTPCGLTGVSMTSMARLGASARPDAVAGVLTRHLAERFDLSWLPEAPGPISDLLPAAPGSAA